MLTTNKYESLDRNRLTQEEIEEIFGKHADIPEKVLMVQVLQYALDDLTATPRKNESKRAKRNREIFEKDAYVWLNEDPTKLGNTPYLYSFESICEHLDLDASVMRKGIMARYEK